MPGQNLEYWSSSSILAQSQLGDLGKPIVSRNKEYCNLKAYPHLRKKNPDNSYIETMYLFLHAAMRFDLLGFFKSTGVSMPHDKPFCI